MIEILGKHIHSREVNTITLQQIEENLKDSNTFLWIDVEEKLEEPPCGELKHLLEKTLNIHPLIIEDLYINKHIPKVEKVDDYLVFIFHEIKVDTYKNISFSKVGILLGENYVLTYREKGATILSSLKERLYSDPNFSKDVSYLFYNILDYLINEYIPAIDRYDDKIEDLEAIIIKETPSSDILRQVNNIRGKITHTRRLIAAEKEAYNELLTIYGYMIKSEKNVYFRDLNDQLDKVIYKLDTQKEEIIGLINLHAGLSSQKLNELIKFLTVVSATFMPATVIAGIFGMGFHKMPLITHEHGFSSIVVLMLLLAIASLIFFRHKKWI